jgi:dinuclear metal center YbgI/SA1388 family protein
MPTVADLTKHLDRFAPPALAAEWDNVGLIVGDPSANVERVLTCLTVTPPVVAEAVDTRVQLIITHHPMLFRASKRLTTITAEGRMLLELIRAGVAVYSPHTAFDNTTGGINDVLARRLGLTDLMPLRKQPGPRQCKVVVFVPEKDLDRVADAMFAAGAGNIGEYSQCSFRLVGTGTFFGSDAANPTIGDKGRREEVSEWRLEAICPEAAADRVVLAMRRAHSYEEPAYDVYPLRSTAAAAGAGRIGVLAAPVALAELARRVKTALNAQLVQVVGDPARTAQRVALACGAAGEFLGDAIVAGADVFLTGEMRFHDYLAAQAQNVALLLPGHYATERCGIEDLAERLQRDFPGLQVSASRRERDPVSLAI